MRVRIYRESRIACSARQIHIFANGEAIATLHDGEEKTIDLPDGDYRIHFQVGGKALSFLSVSSENNDEIFISCWCNATGRVSFRSNSPNVKIHPESTGVNSKAAVSVIVCAIVLIGLLFWLPRMNSSGGSHAGETQDGLTAQQGTQPRVTPHMIQPGEVFAPGAYIVFENVKISFVSDTTFLVENNRDDIVLITLSVVGIKANGEYEFLQLPAFSGIDEQAYAQDLEENGWAIDHYTNKIRPHQSLEATAHIFNFSSQDFPAPDIDGDGYYDIVFTVYPNQTEDGFSVSTDAPETESYKLKVP